MIPEMMAACLNRRRSQWDVCGSQLPSYAGYAFIRQDRSLSSATEKLFPTPPEMVFNNRAPIPQ